MSPQPIVFTEGPLRRLILEELRVDGPQWRTPETFDKGKHCGRPCASTSWRASSRSGSRAATSRVSAARSRSRTGSSGATSLSGSRRSTSGLSACSSEGVVSQHLSDYLERVIPGAVRG
jgi:hypothetical protein